MVETSRRDGANHERDRRRRVWTAGGVAGPKGVSDVAILRLRIRRRRERLGQEERRVCVHCVSKEPLQGPERGNILAFRDARRAREEGLGRGMPEGLFLCGA